MTNPFERNGISIIKKLGPVAGIVAGIIMVTVWLLGFGYAVEAKAARANTRVDSLEGDLTDIKTELRDIKTEIRDIRNILLERRK